HRAADRAERDRRRPRLLLLHPPGPARHPRQAPVAGRPPPPPARRPDPAERLMMSPRLFSPLAIGGVTLPNRIVSSGHDTVMADHGQISDRLIAYHEARARGGVGLIVVQVAGI